MNPSAPWSIRGMWLCPKMTTSAAGNWRRSSVQPAGGSTGVVDDGDARAVGIELELTWKLGAYVRVVDIAVDGDHRRPDRRMNPSALRSQ